MDRKRIADAIERMNRDYPRPSLRLEITEYDLGTWPARYPPGHEGPGVYLFLDASGKLLYVGKASCGAYLGSRLNAYFQHDTLQPYRCTRPDLASTRYILMIPVESNRAFEAPAVEEFLIRELDPPKNKIARSPS